MKISSVALALALCSSFAHAQAATPTNAAPAQVSSRTLAAGQPNHMLAAVDSLLKLDTEFGVLLSLGTLFVGAAAVFSLRRPTA